MKDSEDALPWCEEAVIKSTVCTIFGCGFFCIRGGALHEETAVGSWLMRFGLESMACFTSLYYCFMSRLYMELTS